MKGLLIAFGILVVIGIVEGGLGYVCLNKMLNKKQYSYQHGLEYEISKGNITEELVREFSYSEFNINSPNGYSLYGRYFLQVQPTNKTAVIMHGHAGNLLWSYKYAKIFQDMGYNWFVFDNRGCGGSGEKGYTMGFEESTDLVAVIGYARKIVPTAEIVLHGESLGASTAILALDKDFGDDIKCVIADCGFSDLTEEAKYQLREKHLPWNLVGILASVICEIKHGFFFKNVSPIKVLQKGRFETPILFIHGEKDIKTPCHMASDMFDAYNGEKEIYICENAGHAKSFAEDKVRYTEVVREFCGKFL